MQLVNTLRNQQQKVYTVLGVALAGSIIFWPLLNSILTITIFVYWLLFDKKQFDLSTTRTRWVLLFISLYLLVVGGYFYSTNTEEALFKLQQKLPLLIFPLIFGMGKGLAKETASRILYAFAIFTFIGAVICIVAGLITFFQTGVTVGLRGYDMVILKGMSPFMMGLCCLISVALML
ncbi:MAG: hypothetical protein H7Y27_10175, partial [Gemmatimonadaceae bacterium]|nr:hypothetical protein [Chitinophagaceae bacterium]